MKCKNCKAYNKMKSICDVGIACYMLRCGEYGCALNGKTVNKLLRMKDEPIDVCKKTNGDRFRAMTNDDLAGQFATWFCRICDHCPIADKCDINKYECCCDVWLDWLKQEVEIC